MFIKIILKILLHANILRNVANIFSKTFLIGGWKLLNYKVMSNIY